MVEVAIKVAALQKYTNRSNANLLAGVGYKMSVAPIFCTYHALQKHDKLGMATRNMSSHLCLNLSIEKFKFF